jgi:hypothetical protein
LFRLCAWWLILRPAGARAGPPQIRDPGAPRPRRALTPGTGTGLVLTSRLCRCFHVKHSMAYVIIIASQVAHYASSCFSIALYLSKGSEKVRLVSYFFKVWKRCSLYCRGAVRSLTFVASKHRMTILKMMQIGIHETAYTRQEAHGQQPQRRRTRNNKDMSMYWNKNVLMSVWNIRNLMSATVNDEFFGS